VRRAIPLFGLVTLALAGVVSAQQGMFVPRWVRSVEVVREGANVRARPSTESARRGTVRTGTRLPILGRVMGEGCPGGEWIQVGAEQFVCETLVRYSPSPPQGDEVPVVPPGSITPRAHAFVRTDGTWAYARPADYFQDLWVESLGRGFGYAIVERREVQGTALARTLNNLWIPVSELSFANPSDFHGVEITEARPLESVAWVLRPNAAMRERPGGRIVERGSRLLPLEVAAIERDWARLADGRYISLRDIARPTIAPPPSEVTGGARWIDVDLQSQTLVAYSGATPLYATLVSTGRSDHATPRGTFRIWVKLAEDDMDDLERSDVVENYAIQAVPWVQYFSDSVGLHAAFWHESFGRQRSHGCVNLAPIDARWMFAFTQPAMPPGWDAILPTASEPGSVVRVR
jgi:hypothetical protein